MQSVQQTESGEGVLSVATYKFATDAVARIGPGFPYCDRHTLSAQSDAERQTGRKSLFLTQDFFRLDF
jgi:hypothetical protein